MNTLNVQFYDSTKKEVIAYFASPQDPNVWTNIGTVQDSDPMWATYYASLPKDIQRFMPPPTQS